MVERNRNKKVFIIGLLALILTVVIFAVIIILNLLNAYPLTSQKKTLDDPSMITFSDPTTRTTKASFSVEIADTNAKRETGLMNRKSMDDNSGMLFIFDSEQPLSFWMKNTYIPLDMIFIDEDQKIKKIYRNTIPLNETITYNSEGKYVLEINAGLSDKLNLEEGDTMSFLMITKLLYDRRP